MLEHLDRTMRIRRAARRAAASDGLAWPIANPGASGLCLLTETVYAPIPASFQPTHPAAYPPTLPAAASPAQPPVLSFSGAVTPIVASGVMDRRGVAGARKIFDFSPPPGCGTEAAAAGIF